MGQEDSKFKTLFLCGMMGAGKTTLGQALAEKLGSRAYDLDKLIDLEVGSHQRFLVLKGETAFRELEYQVLSRFLGRAEGAVVSLGGGTLQHPASLALVKESGTLIFLRAKPSTLVLRLQADPKERPLVLSNLGGSFGGNLAGNLGGDLESETSLEARVKLRLSQREAAYLQASQVIDTDGVSVADLAELLRERLFENGFSNSYNHI